VAAPWLASAWRVLRRAVPLRADAEAANG
jgi:hypothetical protein